MTIGSTQIKVVTPKSNDFGSSVYDYDDVKVKLEDDLQAVDPKGVNTVSRSSHRRRLIYQPNSNITYFAHRERWFSWSRHTRPNTFAEGHDRFIELRCLGRSTQPIKELLRDVQNHASTSALRMTEIFMPSRATEYSTWIRQSMRPSRPIDTVSLDEMQRSTIVNDMKAYLHPDTADWYGAGGIQYRRGYLFHGPPGTGKTSLTIALAGLFDLSIYCVPLSSCNLTESDITMLFSDLPPRCVVLLDNVDNASLRGEARPGKYSSSRGHDDLCVGVEKSGGCAGRSQISLAGVLNAIDGAASQEVCFCSPRVQS
jgi:chaperone BCS1